jgi:pseudomonalisin
VLPALASLTPTGVPDPAARITVAVALAAPDQAARDRAFAAMYDPANPEYHRFMTPVEFADRFGVDASTFGRLRGWLEDGGLVVTHVSGSRDYVLADGPVAKVETLFHTVLRTFSWNGTSFYANVVGPTVPSGIPVRTVIGLNSYQRFHTFPGRPPGPSNGPAPALSPNDNIGLQTAPDLWSIYNQPDNNRGQGQTLAVFGEGQTDPTIKDLRIFEDQFGLPHMPVQVKLVGSGPFDDNSGQIEWDIDTQASTGMAPDALREDLYFTKSLSDADVGAEFSAWVSDPNGPLQANASFGECETDPLNPVFGNPALAPPDPPTQGLGDNFEPVGEQILQQAAMEGRTLFSSTGDTGSSCPVVILPVIGPGNGVLQQAVPLLNYPAASRYAVAVGGTVLYSDGNTPAQRSEEYAWTFTGGGTSVFIPAPDFQTAQSHVVGRCITDASGMPTNTGALCRGVPDVAAISGDIVSNGYSIVAGGKKDQSGGGTSLSSPLWVGMWTRVQAAAATPAGNGFANPALYRIGNDPAAQARDFFDVTVGSNGYYTALPGWDYVSGFGPPHLDKLMVDIDGKTAPTNNVLPPAPPPPPYVDPACVPTWIDPPGDDSFSVDGQSHPDLDLLQGGFALLPDGATLEVTLTLADLSGTVPPPGVADEYYMTWNYNGETDYAHASIPVTGTPTFSDGHLVTVGSTTRYTDSDTITGHVDLGAPGHLVIDVPLHNIGSPGRGTDLGQPTGATFVRVGSPTGTGSLQPDDTGGPNYDYVIGQHCTTPPAPATGSGGDDTAGHAPATTTSYFAEGTTLDGFAEYLLLANPSASPADVAVTYYFDDGSAPLATIERMGAQSRSTILVSDRVGTGRTGVSIGVSSTLPVVAERSLYFDRALPPGEINGSHAALGAAQPRRLWNFAEGSTLDGFEEYLTLENPGTTDAHVATVFGTEAGGRPTSSLTIPPGQRRTIDVNTVIGPGVTGHSTRVSADEPIVAERVLYFARAVGDDGIVINGGHVATGADPSPVGYLAEGTVLPGFSEYLTLANPDDAHVQTAVIDYYLGDGTTREATTTVPAGRRRTVRVFDVTDPAGLGRDVADPLGRGVAVKVTTPSSQGLVVERPEYLHHAFRDITTEINDGHDAVAVPSLAGRWAFAEGSTLDGFAPFLTISNPGRSPAHLTLTYTPDSGAPAVRTVDVADHSRRTIQVYGPSDEGGIGSTVTGFGMFVTADQPVLVESPIYVDRQLPGLPEINGGSDVVGQPS